jgi:hypothetical protein
MPWLMVLGLPPKPKMKGYVCAIPFGLINTGKQPLRNVWCQIAYPGCPALPKDYVAEEPYSFGSFTRTSETYPHQVFVNYEISVLRPEDRLGIRELLYYGAETPASFIDLDPTTFVGRTLDDLAKRIGIITLTVSAENLKRTTRTFRITAVPCADPNLLLQEAARASQLAMALATRGQRITYLDGFAWWLVGRMHGTRPMAVYQKDFKNWTKERIGVDDLIAMGRLGIIGFYRRKPTLFDANILAG